MATKIMRHLVSKKKRRFEWGEFDLDLTYITDKIVAMGFPSESLEGLYRNNMKDVQKFFESLHPGRYRIYNLCSERKYDHSKFSGNVAEFPFDDHGPPNLDVIEHFCKDVTKWLDAHPENVIGVHCKAGKGRTGTLVSCYLLYSGYCKSASEACRLFGNKRTLNGKGITIPSQFRYVKYFEQMLLQSKPPPAPLVLPPPTTLVLHTILMYGVPNFNLGGGCEPFLGISQRNKSVYSSKPLKLKKGTEIVEFDCGGTLLARDVKIQFFNKSSKGKMFSLCFHTGYVTGNRLKLRRLELDRANKDAAHKHFAPHFVVELFFREPAEVADTPGTAGAPPVPNPIFVCAFCTKPISQDEVSVHHLGRNWHWNCLTCNICKQPLKDDVIYDKENKPICATCDKTTGFFKYCSSCGLLINSHISEDVGEKSYHKECFECNQCGKYLNNVRFSPAANNKLICEPCLTKEEETPAPPPESPPPQVVPVEVPEPPRTPTPPPPPEEKIEIKPKEEPQQNNHNHNHVEATPAPPPPKSVEAPQHSRDCPSCKREVLISADRVMALGTMWHRECFVCFECKKAFSGNRYYIRNDQGYCEECDAAIRLALLPTCMGCSEYIEDAELTEALGGMWHLDCFNCSHCKHPISGPFASRDGKIYCKTDYETLFCVKCHSCSKIIQGSFFRALDKAYHLECFKCVRCGSSLTTGQYFEIGNRPVCFPCKDGTKFAVPTATTGAPRTMSIGNRFLCEHRTDSFRHSTRRLSVAIKNLTPAPLDYNSIGESSPSDSPPLSPIAGSPPDLPIEPRRSSPASTVSTTAKSNPSQRASVFVPARPTRLSVAPGHSPALSDLSNGNSFLSVRNSVRSIPPLIISTSPPPPRTSPPSSPTSPHSLATSPLSYASSPPTSSPPTSSSPSSASPSSPVSNALLPSRPPRAKSPVSPPSSSPPAQAPLSPSGSRPERPPRPLAPVSPKPLQKSAVQSPASVSAPAQSHPRTLSIANLPPPPPPIDVTNLQRQSTANPEGSAAGRTS